jgi:hypothetical protein
MVSMRGAVTPPPATSSRPTAVLQTFLAEKRIPVIVNGKTSIFVVNCMNIKYPPDA